MDIIAFYITVDEKRSISLNTAEGVWSVTVQNINEPGDYNREFFTSDLEARREFGRLITADFGK